MKQATRRDDAGGGFGNGRTAHGSTTSREGMAVARFGRAPSRFRTAVARTGDGGVHDCPHREADPRDPHGDGVLVPPMEWDPATGAELPELVEVGPAGTIESWTWVPEPTISIRSIGPSPLLLSARRRLDAAAPRRRCRFPWPWPTACESLPLEGERSGTSLTSTASCRARTPRSWATTSARRRAGRDDGLPRIDHLPESGPADSDLVVDASRQHRLVGFRCPVCGRTYAGGRGICPIDSIELTSSTWSTSRRPGRSRTT